MRKILFFSCILAATASDASGQDLQYRLTMKVSAPDNPMISQMPATVSTVSNKDSRIRISMTVPGTMSEVSSIIIGDTMYMVLHDEAQYIRQALSELPRPPVDTATQRKLAAYIPKLRATGETKVIAGQPAERMLWLVELPRGETASMPLIGDTGAVLAVGETWMATDSALNAAHRRAYRAMTALARLTNPIDALSQQHQDRFPLSSLTIFVRRPAGEYDVDKLLTDEPGAEEIARMVTTADQIILAPLPDSLFEVPGGFSERN